MKPRGGCFIVTAVIAFGVLLACLPVDPWLPLASFGLGLFIGAYPHLVQERP